MLFVNKVSYRSYINFLQVFCYIFFKQGVLFYKISRNFNINMPPKRKIEESNEQPKSKTSKPNKFWALGLLDSMNDPDLQVESDDIVVVIKDKYPKAKFHYLILPKEDISDLKKLNSEHVKLLKHMEDVGHKIIKSKIHDGSSFKFGYHARASMQRLHLHVISDDMNSPCLKTKKHWVTFTTGFFLKAKDVREDLEKNGKVTLPSEAKIKEYHETPLACHKCYLKVKNMPSLKKHILVCPL